MKKQTQAVSPFSTGGGGARFELLVGVSYLIKLLRQEVPRGMPDGIVQELHLQQRNRGNPVDDIVVDCRTYDGHKQLFLQVKHSITFSQNQDFAKVVGEAWRQLSGPNFKLDRDAIGLAIGEASNNMTVRRHVADILNWAKTSSNAKAFREKVSALSQKLAVLNEFEEGLGKTLGRRPTQEQVWTLLRHLIVVPFDFGTRAGRDTVDCQNLLIDSVESRDPRHASALYTILYEMASEYAINAGDITREALSNRILAHATFAVPILQRAGGGIAEILFKRLHNRVAAEKNSKKYIPQVFVEVGDIKDRARLFCHPALFLRKVVEKITQLDLFELRRLMTKAGLEPVELQIAPEEFMGTFDSVEHDARCLTKDLQGLKASLLDLKRDRRAEAAKRVPKNRQHVFNEVGWRIGDTAAGVVDWAVEPLLKEVEVARARVFAVVSRAGQGKTNFVCDLAENTLAKHQIPCALFTGKELGSVDKGQLPSYVARAVYGTEYSGTLESLLADIDAEAGRKGTAGLIVIDAINEHPDLRAFSQELETFVEKCLEYPHVRVMLTCRSEYFDARFGNLARSSFADHLLVEREIHERMTPEHRKRLVRGYFRFFRIHPSSMSEHVHRQLSEDPFLLRVFCEAYGDPTATSVISVGKLRHIRREGLFREYFTRKFESLKSRAAVKTGFLVGTAHPYQETLRIMIEWMVEEKRFSDVPVHIIPSDQLGHLDQLLDEDILVRRDLVSDSVLGSNEVINFTFDACRDFLLADYLLNVIFKTDTQRFTSLIRDLTDEQSTVAEGLQDYLFYASRHLQDAGATAIIKSQPWYGMVFVRCVLDLDGRDVTQEDANTLRDICLRGGYWAPRIACYLLLNYSETLSPHANIRVLFDVFDIMTKSRFEALCVSAFGVTRYAFSSGIYPIDKLARDIKSIALDRGQKWSPIYMDLLRLLLYLWNVEDAEYHRPAQSLFREFSEEHPKVAKRLIGEHVRHNRKGYQGDASLWQRE